MLVSVVRDVVRLEEIKGRGKEWKGKKEWWGCVLVLGVDVEVRMRLKVRELNKGREKRIEGLWAI